MAYFNRQRWLYRLKLFSFCLLFLYFFSLLIYSNVLIIIFLLLGMFFFSFGQLWRDRDMSSRYHYHRRDPVAASRFCYAVKVLLIYLGFYSKICIILSSVQTHQTRYNTKLLVVYTDHEITYNIKLSCNSIICQVLFCLYFFFYKSNTSLINQ